MRTRLVRRPGQHGTKDLVEQYGDQLICVRYRYDAEKKQRHKTIELIIETIAWTPRPKADAIVGVRVAANEYALQESLTAVGGKWVYAKRAWLVKYKHVKALGLEQRMVNID